MHFALLSSPGGESDYNTLETPTIVATLFGDEYHSELQIEYKYSSQEEYLDLKETVESTIAPAGVTTSDPENRKDSRGELKTEEWIHPPIVFIGHGGASQDWLSLGDHLRDQHDIEVRAFESAPRSGQDIRRILEEILDKATFAILVMSGEDQLENGNLRARQNVIHEIGLFQGRLGFSKTLLLREKSVEMFSNIDGIQYIQYERGNIRSTFGEVTASIWREFPRPLKR